MIISEHANRILTVTFKSDGYMQLTAIRPNDDPTRVKVTQINMSDEDQTKLLQAILDNSKAREEAKSNK